MSSFLNTGVPARRRIIVLCLALVASGGFAGWPRLHAATPALVSIENFAFTPEHLTVPVGTVVTWQNADDIPHLVVMSDLSFRSKALDTSDRASFSFTKPGEFSYFCGLHPHMTGTVTVVP